MDLTADTQIDVWTGGPSQDSRSWWPADPHPEPFHAAGEGHMGTVQPHAEKQNRGPRLRATGPPIEARSQTQEGLGSLR